MNKMLRYKACKDSIVTLELLEDTITNEKRGNVINDKYAKFRCDRARVIDIVNVETGKNIKKDISIHDASFEYRVGKVATTDFDEDLDQVCAYGIHYFKTEGAALSWFYCQHDKKFPDGEWTTYHENGQKRCDGTFANGSTDGKVIWWHFNGQKRSEKTYKDGKLDGKCTEWRDNGDKESEGTCKNDFLDGKLTYWFPDGHKKSEETYKDGELDGKCTEWFENGNKKSEGIFKNGTKDGEWTIWFKNGKEESKGTFKDNTFVGKWWWFNGKLKTEGSYSNVRKRIKDGKWTEWFENGNKKSKGTFKNGKLDGEWTQWWSDGDKQYEGTFKNGKLDGKHTEWNKQGEETLQYYNNGNKTNPIWKFNYPNEESIEKEILIFADNEDEALDKLFNKYSEQELDLFGHGDDTIDYTDYNREEWKNKLREIMEESSNCSLVRFPPTKILL